tara:strand:+ start:1238 stop:1627 length:390 start_codon:yes stop_codon:yes gene_type:complete
MKEIIFIFIIFLYFNKIIGYSFNNKGYNIKLENIDLKNDKIKLDPENIFDIESNEGTCKVKFDEGTDLVYIKKKFIKNNILNLLLNDKYNEKEKLLLIERFNYLIFEKTDNVSSIQCGGLMNDWETNIF